MVLIITEYAHLISEMLMFQNGAFHERIKEYMNAVEESHKVIEEKYLNTIKDCKSLF